jgi:hypothetical protein
MAGKNYRVISGCLLSLSFCRRGFQNLLPLPLHPPSYWLRLFSSKTFSRVDTTTILRFSHSAPTCLRRWNRQCSETSAYKIQTPGNYPEENILHTEHGKSLKSKKAFCLGQKIYDTKSTKCTNFFLRHLQYST